MGQHVMSKKKKQNPDINFLVQYLRDCCVNSVDATFVEMNRIASGDIQTTERWKVTKALSIVQSEYGFVMESVNSIGYRLVNTDVSAHCVEKRLGRMRGQTRRLRKELDDSTRGKVATMDDCMAYSQAAFLELSVAENTQKSIKSISTGVVIDWSREHEKTLELMLSIQIK